LAIEERVTYLEDSVARKPVPPAWAPRTRIRAGGAR
jgi:hypothetical protein